MRILYLNPVGTPIFNKAMEEVLRGAAEPGTDVDIVSLRRGPWHVEYYYYESLALPDVLHMVKDAENRGYDAVVLGCFYDLALQEAREISERTTITAPAEAAMLTACSLGDKFSINRWQEEVDSPNDVECRAVRAQRQTRFIQDARDGGS